MTSKAKTAAIEEMQEMQDIEENGLVDGMAETLGRDLLEALVMACQQMPDVWQKMPETQQGLWIERMRLKSETIIRQVVSRISAHANENWPIVPALVDTVTFKDGVKTVLQTPKGTQAAHALADAQGSRVVVVVADAEQYLQAMDDIRPDPDQAEIPLSEDAA